MIRVHESDYIVGVWKVERFGLGKVYLYATKSNNPIHPSDIWTTYKNFIYENQGYNIYSQDNEYKNNIVHRNKSESEIINVCNEISQELEMMFIHEKNKILIGGDINKYKYTQKKNNWLPDIVLYPIKRPKKFI